MTTMNFGSFIERARALDVQAGRWLGNADHIEDRYFYIWEMAFKILAFGSYAAVVMIIFAWIVLNAPAHIQVLAGIVCGFAFWSASFFLVRNEDALNFRAALMTEIFMILIILPIIITVGSEYVLPMAIGISIPCIGIVTIPTFLSRVLSDPKEHNPEKIDDQIRRIADSIKRAFSGDWEWYELPTQLAIYIGFATFLYTLISCIVGLVMSILSIIF